MKSKSKNLRFIPKSERKYPTCEACIANVKYIDKVISGQPRPGSDYGKGLVHTYSEGCWLRRD